MDLEDVVARPDVTAAAVVTIAVRVRLTGFRRRRRENLPNGLLLVCCLFLLLLLPTLAAPVTWSFEVALELLTLLVAAALDATVWLPPLTPAIVMATDVSVSA